LSGGLLFSLSSQQSAPPFLLPMDEDAAAQDSADEVCPHTHAHTHPPPPHLF
jgi:hypothetical protein